MVNAAFGSALQAIVTGANGKPVVGVTVVFELPATGAGGEFNGSVTAVTNAKGIAVSPVLIANTKAGTFTVSASVAGVASQAKFTLTNTAAAPSSVSVLSGSQQSTTIDKSYTKILEVLVEDSFDNPVKGDTVTFTAPVTGASGLFAKKSSVSGVTNASGIAAAPSFIANSVAGNFAVTASISTGASTSFSLSNVLTTPTKAKAIAGTPQSAIVNEPFNSDLQLQVTDAHGNVVSGAWVTFNAPAAVTSGLFDGNRSISVQTNADGIAVAPTLTANKTAGKFYVTATVNGFVGIILFSLTNLPGTPASVTVAAGNDQKIGPGKNFKAPLEVFVKDAFDNVISGVPVSFSVQPNDGAGGTFSNKLTTVEVSTNSKRDCGCTDLYIQ
jgi:hypothetical protein